LEFISISKYSNFENRTELAESRAPETNEHSEKKKPIPSIRSSEFESAMAANIGFSAINLVQRLEGWGLAGGGRGAGIEPSPRAP
jgi:hypothetical protein